MNMKSNGSLNEKAKQSELEVAIKPVGERLLKQYTAANEEFKAAKAAKETMDTLLLSRSDFVTYLRASITHNEISVYQVALLTHFQMVRDLRFF